MTTESLVALVSGEQAVAALAPMRAELERGISAAESAAMAGGRRGGSGGGGSGKAAAAVSDAAVSDAADVILGGDETGHSSRESVLRSFLLEELHSHGRVAEGDQLHELLEEVREFLGAAAFRITLDDLLQVTQTPAPAPTRSPTLTRTPALTRT